MDRLYKDYQHRGVEVLFVYTKEAHPGENYPELFSFEEKMERASDFRAKNCISRPVWVDGWDEYAHKRYGYGPNMSFIVDRNGQVVFKANWTNTALLRETVVAILKAEVDRAKGHPVALFTAERIYPGIAPVEMYIEGLKHNGPTALLDVGVKHIIEQRRLGRI